jgi:hypothetical protein
VFAARTMGFAHRGRVVRQVGVAVVAVKFWHVFKRPENRAKYKSWTSELNLTNFTLLKRKKQLLVRLGKYANYFVQSYYYHS